MYIRHPFLDYLLKLGKIILAIIIANIFTLKMVGNSNLTSMGIIYIVWITAFIFFIKYTVNFIKYMNTERKRKKEIKQQQKLMEILKR